MHYLVASQIVVLKAEKTENETAPVNEALMIENVMETESETALMKCEAVHKKDAAPSKY